MFQKIFKSFFYAFRGLKYVWQEERNFRIQSIIALFLIAVIFFFRFSYIESCAVILAITLVLASEILNTVLERTLNKVESNFSSIIGKIKDVMAGVVLINSIGAFIIGILTFWHHFFLNITVGSDLRIRSFVAAFKSMEAAKALLFFTYLGNWQIIIGLSIIAIIILGLLREKRKIVFLTMSLISGEIICFLFKLLIHRQRPDIKFSLIPENGYAFPSGHAIMSVIFYGMVGYFIYKVCKKLWQKLIVLFTFFIFIFLIGSSRIYLGVHWASDIIAGWLIGFSILIFFITVFKRLEKSTLEIKD